MKPLEQATYISGALTTAFVMALLSGCATPPKDQSEKLEVVVPDRWTAGISAVPDHGGGWVADFDDSQLPGLVDEALEHNYDLRAAAARLDSVRADAGISGADRWPSIRSSLSGTRRQRTSTGGFVIASSRSNTFGLSDSFSWELDLWGRLRASHQEAIADWQAAQEDFRAARLSLAARTAQAWFNAVETELQVRLADKTLHSFEDNLSIIQERFERGISPALDLRLTRANVASARRNLEQRQRFRDSAVRNLEVLLGRYPSHQLGLADRMPSVVREVPAGLPSDLLRRRPDLIAAERRLAAADRGLSASKRALLPAIRLTSGGGASTREFRDLLDTDFKVWNLGVNLAQPLFLGGRVRASIRRSRARYQQALARFGQTALTAFREVEGALSAEVFLANEEAALLTAADESIEAENLAWDQYQKGLSGIITVLESQRRSFNAQRSLLQITNQRLQSRVDLYLALGGDFGQLSAESVTAPSASRVAGNQPESVVSTNDKAEKTLF